MGRGGRLPKLVEQGGDTSWGWAWGGGRTWGRELLREGPEAGCGCSDQQGQVETRRPSHSPELPTHGSSPSGAKAGRGGQRAGLAEAHPDVALSIYPCPMWDTCPPHPQPRMVHQPLSTVGGGNQGVGQPSPSCCASQRFSCGGGGGGGEGGPGQVRGKQPGAGGSLGQRRLPTPSSTTDPGSGPWRCLFFSLGG